MYSTNPEISLHDSATLFSDNKCIGTAYGWEHIDKDEDGNVIHVGSPTQTAKDNALLWSLAPEAIDLLRREWEAYPSRSSTDPNKDEWLGQVGELLAKLAQAIPSIDEALHA